MRCLLPFEGPCVLSVTIGESRLMLVLARAQQPLEFRNLGFRPSQLIADLGEIELQPSTFIITNAQHLLELCNTLTQGVGQVIRLVALPRKSQTLNVELCGRKIAATRKDV